MKIKQKDVSIGHWFAPCCLHDLQRIHDSDGLENAQMPELFCGAWECCSEAVDELAKECSRKELHELVKWNRGEGKDAELAAEVSRYIKSKGATR